MVNTVKINKFTFQGYFIHKALMQTILKKEMKKLKQFQPKIILTIIFCGQSFIISILYLLICLHLICLQCKIQKAPNPKNAGNPGHKKIKPQKKGLSNILILFCIMQLRHEVLPCLSPPLFRDASFIRSDKVVQNELHFILLMKILLSQLSTYSHVSKLDRLIVR